MIDSELMEAARAALEANRPAGRQIAMAESCTGGLVAAALTAIPGASDLFDRGFVTYSNAAKVELLGVPEEVLARHGAVSEETARAMALGALARSSAGVAVAVTGVAGPGGGTPAKPVGLVAFARATVAAGQQVHTEVHRFGNLGRDAIRRQATLVALRLLRP